MTFRLGRHIPVMGLVAAMGMSACTGRSGDDDTSSSSSSSSSTGGSSGNASGGSSSRVSSGGGSTSQQASSTVGSSSVAGSSVMGSSSVGASSVAGSSSVGASSVAGSSSVGTSSGVVGSSSVGGASSGVVGSSSVGGASSGVVGSSSVGGASSGVVGSSSVDASSSGVVGSSSAAGGSSGVVGSSSAAGGSSGVVGSSSAAGGSSGVVGSSSAMGSSSSGSPVFYALGGTVSGLTASGLILEDLVTSEVLTVPAGATSFAFSNRASGTAYNVVAADVPAGFDCQVAQGTGMVTADVNNITVTCTQVAFTIGGNVSGLPGASLLELTLVGGPNMFVSNGTYRFLGAYPTGFMYTVTTGMPPMGIACSVSNDVGTVATTDVTNVDVVCVPACGNGALDNGETCDEGDLLPGDGCSDTCQVEAPFIAETEPNEDGTPSVGGNGGGNDFDRTNANAVVAGDVVLAHINVAGDEDVFGYTNMAPQAHYIRAFTSGPPGVACPVGQDTFLNVWDTAGTTPIASNDDVAFGSNSCSEVLVTAPVLGTLYFHVSNYYDDAQGLGSYRLNIVDAGFCGDGTINGPTGAEACEPAGTPTCSATCQVIFVNPCGNGVIDPGEQCDDGPGQAPPANGDGCSSTCQAEPGFVAEVEPNDDGTPDLNGGNGNDFLATAANGPFDAVAGTVTIIAALAPAGDEDGFAVTNTGTTPVLLTAETFGPGGVGTCTGVDTEINIRDAAGTELANDDESGIGSCSLETFTIQPGQTFYVHVIDFLDNTAVARYFLQLRFQTLVCGNGSVDPSEGCDDGNTAAGDGCSATCTVEPGFICAGQPSVCTTGLPPYAPACGTGETRHVIPGAALVIPDNNPAGVLGTVTVTVPGNVARVGLFFNITHTYDSDLDIFLRSPGSATNINMSTANGGSGDNYVNTVLDPTCAAAVTTGTAPFTGCYLPEGAVALNALVGTPAAGDWSLFVVDRFNLDTGTVDNWNLVLCTTP